jgi:hypothetical protein
MPIKAENKLQSSNKTIHQSHLRQRRDVNYYFHLAMNQIWNMSGAFNFPHPPNHMICSSSVFASSPPLFHLWLLNVNYTHWTPAALRLLLHNVRWDWTHGPSISQAALAGLVTAPSLFSAPFCLYLITWDSRCRYSDGPRSGVPGLILGTGQKFFSSPQLSGRLWAHPASYVMGSKGKAAGAWSWAHTSI